mmetsp:Transcript_6309/g.11321  ORF Transcript_6309/g.11321 Transcript_6309/m.11321 type:complete len:272 (-) Transcript_6309:30-845(-)
MQCLHDNWYNRARRCLCLCDFGFSLSVSGGADVSFSVDNTRVKSSSNVDVSIFILCVRAGRSVPSLALCALSSASSSPSSLSSSTIFDACNSISRSISDTSCCIISSLRCFTCSPPVFPDDDGDAVAPGLDEVNEAISDGDAPPMDGSTDLNEEAGEPPHPSPPMDAFSNAVTFSSSFSRASSSVSAFSFQNFISSRLWRRCSLLSKTSLFSMRISCGYGIFTFDFFGLEPVLQSRLGKLVMIDDYLMMLLYCSCRRGDGDHCAAFGGDDN